MKKLPSERLRPIRDEVYNILRNEILSGKYKPGDRLQEEQLSNSLGVSRTPVREALRKLEIDKLVDYYPHRGTVVSDFTTSELEELFQVRIFLEILIHKRTSKNANKEDIKKLKDIIEDFRINSDPDKIMDCVERFNNTVFVISKSEYLTDLNNRVREIIKRIVTTNALDPIRKQKIYEEHRKIVEAIDMKDDELIEKYTIEHIQSSYYKYNNKKLEITENIHH